MRHFLVTFVKDSNEHEQFKFVAETTAEADDIAYENMMNRNYNDYVLEQVNKHLFQELDVEQINLE